MLAHWPEAIMVLEVATIFEIGQLVVELVCLHVEVGRLDVLSLELNVCCQGSALSLEFELFVIMSPVSLDFSEGCWVVEGVGRFSQGVVCVAVGIEEVHEPGGHGGGWSL